MNHPEICPDCAQQEQSAQWVMVLYCWHTKTLVARLWCDSEWRMVLRGIEPDNAAITRQEIEEMARRVSEQYRGDH